VLDVFQQACGYAVVVFSLLLVTRSTSDPSIWDTLSISLLCAGAFLLLYLWQRSGIDQRILFVKIRNLLNFLVLVEWFCNNRAHLFGGLGLFYVRTDQTSTV
jgi:hypothetical protein